MKFNVDKLEKKRSIVWWEMYFDILNRLGVDHMCDRQTDRRNGY